jgi:diguanylate cyclase (GGDEF)-like protein/putative nucleotidyltransferase with HDIG domain
MLAMIFLLCLVIFFLYRKYAALLKEQNRILDQYHIYKAFMDADPNLIYVKDKNLKYMFINKAVEQFYHKTEAELLGQDDFKLHEEKMAISLREMEMEVLKSKKMLIKEIHWRQKKFQITKFPVLISDGNYGVGACIKDVTKDPGYRKKIEKTDAIQDDTAKHQLYTDPLTGLYNRRYFQEEIYKLDHENNLPISIIMADINGLKLTNDIFGHSSGDLLIQKSAQILKNACRNSDIVVRLGGDEFVIILPRTNSMHAEDIMERIKNQLMDVHIKSFQCSISLGYDTKLTAEEDIFKVMNEAEDKMYSDKTLNRRNISSATIHSIMHTLHENNIREEEHSKNVSKLCQDMGKEMNLSESEIRRLKDAGYLHDIGKIVLNSSLLNKNKELSNQEWQEIEQHPVVGYRILNSSDETVELARYILSHHERWDGSGYPKGLKGEDIPRLARIIAIAESYDNMTANKPYKKAKNKEEALLEIRKQSGTQFDPDLVEAFITMIKRNSK